MFNQKYKLIFLTAFLLMSCGSGSRKLTENPQPIGIIPFAGSNLAPRPEDANQHILREFENSGSFRIEILDSIPKFYNRQDLESLPGTSPKWILTGIIQSETEQVDKGKLPALIYKPSNSIVVKLGYRLFNLENKSWTDIGEITAKSGKGGNYQLIDFDRTDPSLAISASERQELRALALQRASAELIKRVEKNLEIEK